jgi:hypothetical protein
MGVAKIENVQEILPHRCQNMKGWVKARDRQSHNFPHESISITILCLGSGESHSNAAEGRKQARDNFHHGAADLRIAMGAKTRWAETLKAQPEIDRIEGHKRKEVHQRNVLKIVIE